MAVTNVFADACPQVIQNIRKASVGKLVVFIVSIASLTSSVGSGRLEASYADIIKAFGACDRGRADSNDLTDILYHLFDGAAAYGINSHAFHVLQSSHSSPA